MRYRTLTIGFLAILALWILATPSVAQESEATAEETDSNVLDAEGVDVSRIEQILRGEQQVLQGELFSYDPAGRRDPFRSLLTTRPGEDVAEEARPPGLPGMLIEELRLQGIIQTSTGVIAFVQGRDKISYIIQPGTKLYNGEVQEILPDRVIFKQQVSDPKQLQPYEEVVRSLEDVKK